MKKNQVTAELLRRYHAGACSEEERRVVVEWLLSPDPGQDLPALSAEEETRMEKELWQGMTIRRNARSKPIGPLFWWMSAACLLLFFYIGAVKSDNRQLALDNMKGAGTKTITSDGLVFRLGPKSSVEASTNFWGSAGSIRFCGSMEIINQSGRDIELVFNSTCKKSEYTRKRVICKSGKSYFALHHFLTQDEIIIVNRERGNSDLPGAVMI